MKTRILQLTPYCLLAMSLFACSEDEKPIVKPTPSPYKALTEPANVLHNFELAYNEMNIGRYREMIDPDEFIFYFAPDEPEGSWTREQDDMATANMFGGEPSRDPRYGRIVSIDLKIQFNTVQWDSVPPDSGFAGEVWLRVIVNHLYSMDVEPNYTFINGSDARSSFIVRRVAANNRTEWRLVRWWDLGFGQRTGGGRKDPMPSPTVQEATWGAIKSLYR